MGTGIGTGTNSSGTHSGAEAVLSFHSIAPAGPDEERDLESAGAPIELQARSEAAEGLNEIPDHDSEPPISPRARSKSRAEPLESTQTASDLHKRHRSKVGRRARGTPSVGESSRST